MEKHCWDFTKLNRAFFCWSQLLLVVERTSMRGDFAHTLGKHFLIVKTGQTIKINAILICTVYVICQDWWKHFPYAKKNYPFKNGIVIKNLVGGHLPGLLTSVEQVNRESYLLERKLSFFSIVLNEQTGYFLSLV